MSKIGLRIKDIIGRTKRERTFFVLSFILFIAILTFVTSTVWSSQMKERTNGALTLARVVEAGLSTEKIKGLEVNANDINKAEYQDIKDYLVKITSIHQDIRFAYIMALKEDKLYFVADSEAVDSTDYSPPGQGYEEARESNWAIFEGEEGIVTEDEDRWGSWVSVMIPIHDPGTGEVLASLGFDYTHENWYGSAILYTIIAGFIMLCIYVIMLFIYAVIKQNKAIKKEERKLVLANEKISEKEEMFRTIFEQSPIGISINDKYGVIDVNSMYSKIVGRSEKDLLHEGWKNFTHPDDLEMEQEYFNNVMSGKSKGYRIYKRYIRPDGTIIWANLTIAALSIGVNQEAHYICLVEDVTERVRAEIDLRENERSYSVLLSNLPGMAYRCAYDPKWTMKFVSDGCYDLTGYKVEALLNNKEISFNDLIDPKYQKKLWDKWAEVVNEKTKLTEEYEIITASGEKKWVFEQGQAVYDEKGNVTALEGLLIDITARKNKEDEITYLNYHDPLTGIYNRRYIDEKKKEFDVEDQLPLSIIIGDINGVKLVNDGFGHAAGDILIKATAETIQSCCRAQDILARTGGDEFSILLPRTDREATLSILNRIKEACEEYNLATEGGAYSLSISLGFHTKEKAEEDLDDIIKIAEDNMYKRKLFEHKSSHSVILSSIKATMYERSHETQEHAERIATLAKAIGNKLMLPQDKLDELELLATLHDIGKVGIDDSILNKKGKLSIEEWNEMKKHSEIGYRIARSSQDLMPIAEYILCLHERWDGKGYPQGIKEREIPLLSRIVSVVDAYDAMTEDRAYRTALTQKAAIEELRVNAGSQFDPEMVGVFLEILSK